MKVIINIFMKLKEVLCRKIFLCFFAVFFAFNNVSCIAFDDENNNIPQDVIKFANQRGYETPKKIWYLSNTCIKDTIYTDIFFTQKKNNEKYRYILHNDKHTRFATKSEQLKYIENRYF